MFLSFIAHNLMFKMYDLISLNKFSLKYNTHMNSEHCIISQLNSCLDDT